MFTYSIVLNNYDNAKKISKKVNNTLIKNGFEFNEKNPKYVFVIGGDGTFLKAFHQYESNFDQIIFIPIHMGGFGFYTKSNKICNLKEIINKIKQSNFSIKKYSAIKLISDNYCLYAINEIKFVNCEKAIKYFLKINNDEVKKMKGSGLSICSSTGSSGFNKSNNGSIIYDPTVPTMQVTEINSCYLQDFFNIKTSLIFFDKTCIEIKIDKDHELIVDAKKINSNNEYILTIGNKKICIWDCN